MVGGFGITDRMLKMFSKRKEATPAAKAVAEMSSLRLLMERLTSLASILFVLALKGMSHPETARRGMFLAEGGMLAAIIGTLIGAHIVTWVWIIAGLAIGSIIGAWMAIWVPMTAMPSGPRSPTHSARWPRPSWASANFWFTPIDMAGVTRCCALALK